MKRIGVPDSSDRANGNLEHMSTIIERVRSQLPALDEALKPTEAVYRAVETAQDGLFPPEGQRSVISNHDEIREVLHRVQTAWE